MNKRIIQDVNIKCEKCGRDIGFKVYYESNKEIGDNKYKKANVIVKIDIKRFKLILFHPCFKKNSSRYFIES